MTPQEQLNQSLALIFQGIRGLKDQFPGKEFTIDGRLVGDIGEVIAALEYDIKLYEVQTPLHDGTTSAGRKVQVKATFKDKLSITAVPDYYVGLLLFRDGSHREVFNGPGEVIRTKYGHRMGFGAKQLSFSITELEKLSRTIPEDQRIPRRAL